MLQRRGRPSSGSISAALTNGLFCFMLGGLAAVLMITALVGESFKAIVEVSNGTETRRLSAV